MQPVTAITCGKICPTDDQAFRQAVSAENDSGPSCPAMLTMSTPEYLLQSMCLNLLQDSPAVADKGKTIARIPPGFNFLCASAANADASPAFPW